MKLESISPLTTNSSSEIYVFKPSVSLEYVQKLITDLTDIDIKVGEYDSSIWPHLHLHAEPWSMGGWDLDDQDSKLDVLYAGGCIVVEDDCSNFLPYLEGFNEDHSGLKDPKRVIDFLSLIENHLLFRVHI